MSSTNTHWWFPTLKQLSNKKVGLTTMVEIRKDPLEQDQCIIH